MRRILRSVLFTAVLAMLAGLIAPNSVGAAPVPAGRQPENVRLQALLDELVATGAPGALALVDDGRGPAWHGVSGAAQLDPLVPLRPPARFRVGSITKTFVSVVALQLVGEGRLRLDDTVEQWLPGLVPSGDGINVRQLLNHTSGIFNYTDDPDLINDLITDPLRTVTPEQLIAVATAYPPLFEPGTSWSYSNTNYILTGLIIQAVTGRGVQEELQQRIFTPLGLRDTSFPLTDPDIAGYHAHGYLLPGNPFIPTDVPIDVTRFNPSWAWAAGAVISTADDLSRFYRALLGGRLLGPALLGQMLTTVQVDPVFGYGLGIYSMRTACGTVWGHDGGVPGYVSIALNNRQGTRNLVLMISTNPDAQIGPLLSLTLDTAICDMLDRNASRTTPISTWVTHSTAPALLR